MDYYVIICENEGGFYMYFVFGIAAIFILFSYIQFITGLCVHIPMGFRIKNLRFLVWDMTNINGKYRCTSRSFSPFCQHQFMKINMTDKEDMVATAIDMVLQTIISIIIFMFSFSWAKDDFKPMRDDAYAFVMGIAIGVAIQIVQKWLVYIKFLFTKDKQLIYFMKKVVRDCENGYRLEYINLPELDKLELESTNIHRLNYQHIRFTQKLVTESYDELLPIVTWYESNFQKDFAKYEAAGYADVVYYYSYVNRDEQKAMKYFSIAREELENEVDSNGRRILSYYQFYVMKNPIMAKQTALAGLEVLDMGMLLEVERELEKKLLNNLIDVINNMENVTTDN